VPHSRRYEGKAGQKNRNMFGYGERRRKYPGGVKERRGKQELT